MTNFELVDEVLPGGNIFPVAYGTEEETGLLDNTSGQMDEPYILAGSLRQYIAPELLVAMPVRLYFLKMASKFTLAVPWVPVEKLTLRGRHRNVPPQNS